MTFQLEQQAFDPQPATPKTRRTRLPRHGWTLEPHVCRACLGRIVSQTNAAGTTTYQCTNCGTTGQDRPASICTCGAKFNTGRDMGLRCAPNPDPSPQSPSLFVAMEPI